MFKGLREFWDNFTIASKLTHWHNIYQRRSAGSNASPLPGSPACESRISYLLSLNQGCELVRLGFRNKTGFHECPQCLSRSVWKADPYGTFEETLHKYLRLSPYRCARCDTRFMDSKIPTEGAPPRLIRRWLSRGWRLLQRTPLDESLRLYSILDPLMPTTAGHAGSRLGDRSSKRSRSAASEAVSLRENRGVNT
jgi:hypothetical protein